MVEVTSRLKLKTGHMEMQGNSIYPVIKRQQVVFGEWMKFP